MTLRKLLSISIIKTVYFNLKYFPLRVACKLPAFIYKKTDLTLTGGKIQLLCTPRRGIIEIGNPEAYSLYTKKTRTKWKCEGKIIFNGHVKIGSGSVIRVYKNGILSFGKNFTISGRSSIICQKDISFGDDDLLSWDILIMDTDSHTILNREGEVINSPSSIHIGNRVWIGCRSMILKGVVLSDNIIVAAGSTITKSVENQNAIICNVGVLKQSVSWRM